MDCVVPKPSEVLFLISAGLWAEIFAPRALQSFENIQGEKKECKYINIERFYFQICTPAWCVLASLPFPY